MVGFAKKCDTYAKDVKKATIALKYGKAISISIGVVLVLLGVLITALTTVVACLAISLLGVVGALVTLVATSIEFTKANARIKEEYIRFYQPVNTQSATWTGDNQGYLSSIGGGTPRHLLCWLAGDRLNYISEEFLAIDSFRLKSTKIARYNSILATDFGKLVIPVSEIDHYRDNIIVCPEGDKIIRLNFADDKALDSFIPQKEYYYSSAKKNNLSV